MNNRQFANNPDFKALCESAGLKGHKTRGFIRQAAKYRQKRGKAWENRELLSQQK